VPLVCGKPLAAHAEAVFAASSAALGSSVRREKLSQLIYQVDLKVASVNRALCAEGSGNASPYTLNTAIIWPVADVWQCQQSECVGGQAVICLV